MRRPTGEPEWPASRVRFRMLGVAITIVSLLVFFWGSYSTSYLWATGVLLGIVGCSWMAYVLIRYGTEHRAGVELALATLTLIVGILYARTEEDLRGPSTLQVVLAVLLILAALVVLNFGIQVNRKGGEHRRGSGRRR